MTREFKQLITGLSEDKRGNICVEINYIDLDEEVNLPIADTFWRLNGIAKLLSKRENCLESDSILPPRLNVGKDTSSKRLRFFVWFETVTSISSGGIHAEDMLFEIDFSRTSTTGLNNFIEHVQDDGLFPMLAATKNEGMVKQLGIESKSKSGKSKGKAVKDFFCYVVARPAADNSSDFDPDSLRKSLKGVRDLAEKYLFSDDMTDNQKDAMVARFESSIQESIPRAQRNLDKVWKHILTSAEKIIGREIKVEESRQDIRGWIRDEVVQRVIFEIISDGELSLENLPTKSNIEYKISHTYRDLINEIRYSRSYDVKKHSAHEQDAQIYPTTNTFVEIDEIRDAEHATAMSGDKEERKRRRRKAKTKKKSA